LHIIGIHGAMYAGKDALGEGFEKLGLQRFGFGDKLKEAANDLCKTGIKDFKAGKTPYQRLVLQHLATEGLRKLWTKVIRQTPKIIEDLRKQGYLYPECFWSIHLQDKLMATSYEDQPGFYVPDVRFEDEAEFILRMGGKLVKIIRPVENTKKMPKRVTKHKSEQGLKDYNKWHYIINNNDSLESLHRAANLILSLPESYIYNTVIDCAQLNIIN
jgi:hypothetical protein